MIRVETTGLPDKVAVRQENAEVEIGIGAAPSGKLVFAPLPKLLEGEVVPRRAEQVSEYNKSSLFENEGIRSELERMLLQYDKLSDSANYLARLSNLAILAGQLDRAHEFASRAALLSQSPEYRARLAEVAYFRTNIDEARQIWTDLAEEGDFDAMLRMAQLSVSEANYHIAMKWLEEAMSIDSTDWRAHIVAGTIALALAEHERAVRHFRVAMEDRPRSVQLYYNLALAHALSGSTKHALRAMRIAVGLNPFSQKSLVAWADLCLYEEKNLVDASRALDRYASLYPSDKLAIERLAHVKYRLGDNFGAREILKNALQRFGDASISNNLGVLSARGKNLGQAIREFGKAIAIAVQSEEEGAEHTADIATTNLVTALIRAREFEKAEEIADAYLSLVSDDVVLLNDPIFRIAEGLVSAFLNQGKNEKGISLALEWICKTIHPDLNASLANTLVCYYSLVEKQLDRARAFALQAYQVQSERRPKDIRAWNISVNNIAYVAIEQGQLDEASAFLSGFRSDVELNRHYEYATRGLLAIRRGQIDRGAGLYRLAISTVSDRDVKSLLRQKLNWELGKYWVSKGNIGKAIRLLEKVQRTRVSGIWTIPFVKSEAAHLLGQLRRS